MTTTPGLLARRLAGTWKPEGSYILQVATAAELPAAPANDDVFAFVHATEQMKRSKAGAWVDYPPAPAPYTGPKGIVAWNTNTYPSGGSILTTPVVIGSLPSFSTVAGRYYIFTTQIRAILAGGDTVFTVSCRVGGSDIRQEQLTPVRAAPQFWGGGTYAFLYAASSVLTGVNFYGACSVGGVNFYNDNSNSWVQDVGPQ